MVCCHILSGKQAGGVVGTANFPWRVGRSAGEDLRLEEAGVWDHHFELVLDFTEGFILQTHPEARALVNGQVCDRVRLRSGDLIEFGSVKLQFWLAETVLRSLRLTEILVALLVAFLSVGQVGVIYWLTR